MKRMQGSPIIMTFSFIRSHGLRLSRILKPRNLMTSSRYPIPANRHFTGSNGTTNSLPDRSRYYDSQSGQYITVPGSEGIRIHDSIMKYINLHHDGHMLDNKSQQQLYATRVVDYLRQSCSGNKVLAFSSNSLPPLDVSFPDLFHCTVETAQDSSKKDALVAYLKQTVAYIKRNRNRISCKVFLPLTSIQECRVLVQAIENIIPDQEGIEHGIASENATVTVSTTGTNTENNSSRSTASAAVDILGFEFISDQLVNPNEINDTDHKGGPSAYSPEVLSLITLLSAKGFVVRVDLPLDISRYIERFSGPNAASSMGFSNENDYVDNSHHSSKDRKRAAVSQHELQRASTTALKHSDGSHARSSSDIPPSMEVCSVVASLCDAGAAVVNLLFVCDATAGTNSNSGSVKLLGENGGSVDMISPVVSEASTEYISEYCRQLLEDLIGLDVEGDPMLERLSVQHSALFPEVAEMAHELGITRFTVVGVDSDSAAVTLDKIDSNTDEKATSSSPTATFSNSNYTALLPSGTVNGIKAHGIFGRDVYVFGSTFQDLVSNAPFFDSE